MIKTVYARVESPQMANSGRLSLLRPGGEKTANCVECETPVTFHSPQHETVETEGGRLLVACSDECAHKAGFYRLRLPKRTPVVVKPVKPVEEDVEPSTEHEATPTESVPKSEKPATCPQCGGGRRGRGYSHKDDCPAKGGKVPL